MRVFVTGGTGLLGSHAAERLRNRGHEVTALCRPNSDTVHLRSLGCRIVDGNLTDAPREQAGRMAGCDALLHAAAQMYGGRSLGAVRAVNVLGTRRIFDAAVRSGIRHAVHVSSVAVYGDAPPPVTEDVPPTAPLREADFYGLSKREGEAVAASFHGLGGVGVTILRPPAVYGERDRLFVPRLAALVRRPVVFLLGSGTTTMSAVYAGNLAQVIESALEGRGAGDVFNVTCDVPLTLRAFYQALAATMGARPRYVSLPAALARAGARAGDALGVRIPGAADLSLARTVRLATSDNPYPATKAYAELGWDPPFSLEEALRRTGAWVRAQAADTPGG